MKPTTAEAINRLSDAFRDVGVSVKGIDKVMRSAVREPSGIDWNVRYGAWVVFKHCCQWSITIGPNKAMMRILWRRMKRLCAQNS